MSSDFGYGVDDPKPKRPFVLLGVVTWLTRREWFAVFNLKHWEELPEDRFYVIATTLLLLITVAAACVLTIAHVDAAQTTAVMSPLLGFLALLIYQYKANMATRKKQFETQAKVGRVEEKLDQSKEAYEQEVAAMKRQLLLVNDAQTHRLEEIRQAGQRTLQLVDSHQQACLSALARVTRTMAALTGDPEDDAMARKAEEELSHYIEKASVMQRASEARRRIIEQARKSASQQVGQGQEQAAPQPEPDVRGGSVAPDPA